MNYFYKKLLSGGTYQYEARSVPIKENDLIEITKDEYLSALNELSLENSKLTTEQIDEC